LCAGNTIGRIVRWTWWNWESYCHDCQKSPKLKSKTIAPQICADKRGLGDFHHGDTHSTPSPRSVAQGRLWHGEKISGLVEPESKAGSCSPQQANSRDLAWNRAACGASGFDHKKVQSQAKAPAVHNSIHHKHFTSLKPAGEGACGPHPKQ
jgi:hypothetical protein